MKKAYWKELSQVLFDHILMTQWEFWMEGNPNGVSEEQIVAYMIYDDNSEERAKEAEQVIDEMNKVTSVYQLSRKAFEAFVSTVVTNIHDHPDNESLGPASLSGSLADISYARRKQTRKAMKRAEKQPKPEPVPMTVEEALSRQPQNPNEEPFDDEDDSAAPLDRRPILGEDD